MSNPEEPLLPAPTPEPLIEAGEEELLLEPNSETES